MKKTLSLLFAVCLLSSVVCAQSEMVTVFEAVKIKNDKRAEAIYYYENNWMALRKKAIKKGYIHSFEIIFSKADEKANFDIGLVTRFQNQSQYDKAEENFGELIKQRGELKLLNSLRPGEFRQGVFVKIGSSKLGHFSPGKQTSRECASPDLSFFDFLIGSWQKTGATGKKEIKKILGGCAIREEWRLEGFNATLLRNFDESTNKWYLTFTAHNLVPQVWEGRLENGNWYFYRDWKLNGQARKSRTFWKKISGKSFERIVEQLNDDGKTWRLHVKETYQKEN